jgi:hypothetical protein
MRPVWDVGRGGPGSEAEAIIRMFGALGSRLLRMLALSVSMYLFEFGPHVFARAERRCVPAESRQ